MTRDMTDDLPLAPTPSSALLDAGGAVRAKIRDYADLVTLPAPEWARSITAKATMDVQEHWSRHDLPGLAVRLISAETYDLTVSNSGDGVPYRLLLDYTFQLECDTALRPLVWGDILSRNSNSLRGKHVKGSFWSTKSGKKSQETYTTARKRTDITAGMTRQLENYLDTHRAVILEMVQSVLLTYTDHLTRALNVAEQHRADVTAALLAPGYPLASEKPS